MQKFFCDRNGCNREAKFIIGVPAIGGLFGDLLQQIGSHPRGENKTFASMGLIGIKPLDPMTDAKLTHLCDDVLCLIAKLEEHEIVFKEVDGVRPA